MSINGVYLRQFIPVKSSVSVCLKAESVTSDGIFMFGIYFYYCACNIKLSRLLLYIGKDRI